MDRFLGGTGNCLCTYALCVCVCVCMRGKRSDDILVWFESEKTEL